MPRNDVPKMYDFPDKLTFVAHDGEGNVREVNYYRADAYISIFGSVEDLFALDHKCRDWCRAETENQGE